MEVRFAPEGLFGFVASGLVPRDSRGAGILQKEACTDLRLPVEILRLGHIRYSPLKAPRLHRHDFFHVIFVLNGRGWVNVNGTVHEVGTGDVHVYHPAWSHDVWTRPHAHLEVLDLRFVVSGDAERAWLADMSPFLREETYPILDLLRRIERVGRTRRGRLWQELAHAYLIQLLAGVLHREAATATLPLGDEYGRIVGTALHIMQESLPMGISVAALAERLSMSPTHLANIFKRAVGESPSTTMTRLKLEDCVRAMALESDVPVYVFRRRYGWRDERHFRRLFKRYVGCTPGALVGDGHGVATSARTVEHWLIFNENYPMRWIDDAVAE